MKPQTYGTGDPGSACSQQSCGNCGRCGERDEDDELAYCASCGHVLDRIAIKVRHHDQWVWVCGELCQQDLEARVE